MAVWQAIKVKNLSHRLRLDPEFYRPEYTKLIDFLKKSGATPISNYSTDISRGKLPEYSDTGKIGVIKSAKIQSGFIDEGDEFVDSDFCNRHPEAIVQYSDILINSTGRGTLGRSAIFLKPARHVIDGHVTRIRDLKNIPYFYVAIYLLSRYGFSQLDIMAHGSSGQIEIYPEDIGNVLIPKISPKAITRIDNLCKELYGNLEKTKNYYQEVDQELLERMEWGKLAAKHTLNYTVASKDIRMDERLDPEFYQPKFKNLEKHLKEVGAIKLGEFCSSIKRGTSPIYVENGKVSIVNSQNLSADGSIDIDDLAKTSDDFYADEKNNKARLSQFDVLVYATGAYIGRTNCWLETRKAVAGIDCIIIQPRKDICDPVYLSLFLNSKPGFMQANQRASGSAQRHLYPNDLSRYSVFIPHEKNGKPDLMWQKKLAEKIVAANEAKKSAKQKLEEAKRLIENEIEQLI